MRGIFNRGAKLAPWTVALLLGVASSGGCDTLDSEQSCSRSNPGGCGDGAYCSFDDDMCGERFAEGTCFTRPGSCEQSNTPVCGCDGLTYEGGCKARQAGTDVAFEGTCESGQGGTAGTGSGGAAGNPATGGSGGTGGVPTAGAAGAANGGAGGLEASGGVAGGGAVPDGGAGVAGSG